LKLNQRGRATESCRAYRSDTVYHVGGVLSDSRD